ncbi:MAG: DUF3105 domain-containing protein [Alphaproteobacteria bacterium]|nr:DUF3105 domain-containing protein [Alphaproteobacteria bacterium]
MRALLIAAGAIAVVVVSLLVFRPAPEPPAPPAPPAAAPPAAAAPATPPPAPGPAPQAAAPTAPAAPSETALAEFGRLVAAGQAALSRVDTFPNDGQNHVPVGSPVRYRTDPPVAGDHWPIWADPGRYNQAVPNEALVHSLEHGHIVISIDRPNAEGVRLLTLWANMYRGMWDGLVVVPRANLGGGVILTAWQKILRLNEFEPAPAAAFVDQFRGRGPENPVR